jgi:phage tail-like protein
MTAVEPLPANRFTVRWDDADVAGVSRVGPLQSSPDGWAAVSLERPAGIDGTFERWALAALAAGDPAAQRKRVTVSVLDASGTPALAYDLSGCLPVAYSPLGELDAAGSALALETLALAVASVQPQPPA